MGPNPESTGRVYTHLIEPQLLDSLTPDEILEKQIELLGSIAESGEVFT